MRGFRLRDVVVYCDRTQEVVRVVVRSEVSPREMVAERPLRLHSAGDVDYQMVCKKALRAEEMNIKNGKIVTKVTYCIAWTCLTYSKRGANKSLISVVSCMRWQAHAVISWQCERKLQCI